MAVRQSEDDDSRGGDESRSVRLLPPLNYVGYWAMGQGDKHGLLAHNKARDLRETQGPRGHSVGPDYVGVPRCSVTVGYWHLSPNRL